MEETIYAFCTEEGNPANSRVITVGSVSHVSVGRSMMNKNDKGVSRNHLLLKKVPGQMVVIAEVLSDNGVLYCAVDAPDATPVHHGKGASLLLRAGDRIIVRSADKTLNSCYVLTLHKVQPKTVVAAEAADPPKPAEVPPPVVEPPEPKPVEPAPKPAESAKDERKSPQPLRKRHSSFQAMSGLMSYSQDLKALAVHAEDVEEVEEAEETKEERLFNEQCQIIKECLPGASMESIKEALKKTHDIDAACSILFDAKMEQKAAAEAAAMDERCAKMVEAFPELPVDVISEVVKTTKTDEESKAILQIAHEERKKSESPPKPRDKAEELQEFFPEEDIETLRRVLEECGQDLEKAGNAIRRRREQPVPEYPKYSDGGVPHVRLYPPRGDPDMKISWKVRTEMPSQSLLGLGEADRRNLKRIILDTIRSSGVRDRKMIQHVAQCFQKMVYREQEFHKDFAVFYHSYSYAHLLYEVQSVLANILLSSEDDSPLPRLLYQPFDGIPSMKELLEASKCSEKDHNSKFRGCALSVSNSIFAFTSEAPPLSCFVSGYSCTDLDFKSLLTNLLKAMFIPNSKVQSVASRICRIAMEHGLNSSMFMPGGSRPPSGGMDAPSYPGHMLQIFVNRRDLDDVAYDSLPYGVYSGRGLLSTLLTPTHTSLGSGQARLFVHPELMLDSNRTRIFHYSASPSFSAKRPAFREDIKTVLLEFFKDYETLRKASCFVRAIPYTPAQKKPKK